MEISNYRNKSALNKINTTISIKNESFSNPSDYSNHLKGVFIRNDKGKFLKYTEKLPNTRFSYNAKKENLDKINTALKTGISNISIRNYSPLESIDFNKSIITKSFDNEFFTEQIQNLKNTLKMKDEFISSIKKENVELREKIIRIKNKLKKFVNSYKELKLKLKDRMKSNLVNISNEVIRENLSTETIELPHIRKFNSTPKNKIHFDKLQAFKNEDILNNINTSSQSIIITETDLSPINRKHRSIILSNSIDNRNMEFSFRSFDNNPRFYNEKNDNTTLSTTLLQENLPKSSDKLMLENIKIKTKNLLELYRNRMENFKF